MVQSVVTKNVIVIFLLFCQMGALRLFFALSVLLGHISIALPISDIYAVQGFFIISGFYMSLILNEKYPTSKDNFVFYKKRFLRLLPTYWLLTLFAIIISWCYYHIGVTCPTYFFDFKHFPSNASFSTIIFIILSNFFAIGQDFALFLGISPESGNIFFSAYPYDIDYPLGRYMFLTVAWSIGAEFTFYIIAPFILRGKNRIVFILVLLSALSNFFTNYYGLNNNNWRFRFFPSILIFFLSGYYAYWIFNKIRNRLIPFQYRLPILFVLLLLLSVFLNIQFPYIVHELFLLAYGTVSVPVLFCMFKKDRLDREIGEVSYPLYLIHPLFIGVNELVGFNSRFFIVFFSLVGAYICFKFFITPLEKIRNRVGYSSR